LEQRLGGFNIGCVKGIVDFRQHSSLFNRGAVIDRFAVLVLAEGVDLPGTLCTHVHDFFGFHRSSGVDGGSQITPFHGNCPQHAAISAWDAGTTR
jgi:hypothetical protein